MATIQVPELPEILLVDDSDNDVELTLFAFESLKLANRITVANDGVEALDYLYCRDRFAGRPPNAPVFVLLDLKMPRIDGFEFLRQIRDDPSFKSLPVVVMTSSAESPDIDRSYALGANAYVVKPVDYDGFVRAVKNLGPFWALLNEPPPSLVRRGMRQWSV